MRLYVVDDTTSASDVNDEGLSSDLVRGVTAGLLEVQCQVGLVMVLEDNVDGTNVCNSGRRLQGEVDSVVSTTLQVAVTDEETKDGEKYMDWTLFFPVLQIGSDYANVGSNEEAMAAMQAVTEASLSKYIRDGFMDAKLPDTAEAYAEDQDIGDTPAPIQTEPPTEGPVTGPTPALGIPTQAPTTRPTPLPTTTPSVLGPTPVPSVCMTEKVVTLEDFEGPLDQVSQGWSGNLLRYESDGNFTQFLGRLFLGNLVMKSFRVPPQTKFLEVDFDFYKIDQSYKNGLMVIIGRGIIDFGKFLPDVDEGHRSGTTDDCGITWTLESKGPPHQIGFNKIPDEVLHATVTVPANCYDNHFKSVKIGFKMTGVFGGRGGLDNLSILAQYPCDNAPTQAPLKTTVPSSLIQKNITNPPSRERQTALPSSFIVEEQPSQERRTGLPSSFIVEQQVATEPVPIAGTMIFKPAPSIQDRRPPEQTTSKIGEVVFEESTVTPLQGTLSFDQNFAMPAPTPFDLDT
jgi:hypothetical protein